MNYFELFEQPISFELDLDRLTSQYYNLSKKYHPDRFTLASEQDQAAALEKSAEVNKAFKILKDENSRIRYILDLFNAAPQEGKEKMSQEFLLEMMDLNEAIMEYKFDPSNEKEVKIREQIETFKVELDTTAHPLKANFDFSNPNREELDKIKTLYLKKKYLKRLEDNLQNREAEI